MDFDIHQLDGMTADAEEDEEAFDAFQQALLERFAQSPEGQARLKADPDMGFWAAQLMYYGYQYEGEAVPRMTVGDVRTVVTDLFPRKISLHSPEQADDAIPELVAFWKFLKREFHLPQADAVLEFLREVEPDFPDMMNDPVELRHGEVVCCDGPGRRVRHDDPRRDARLHGGVQHGPARPAVAEAIADAGPVLPGRCPAWTRPRGRPRRSGASGPRHREKETASEGSEAAGWRGPSGGGKRSRVGAAPQPTGPCTRCALGRVVLCSSVQLGQNGPMAPHL